MAAPWYPFPAGVVVESFGEDGDDRLQKATRRTAVPATTRSKATRATRSCTAAPATTPSAAWRAADHVYGDEGNDIVSGDSHKAASPDLIDGGPGVDRIEHDWVSRRVAMVLTLAGGADDGRPGEGDDVRGVERLKSFQPGATSAPTAPTGSSSSRSRAPAASTEEAATTS